MYSIEPSLEPEPKVRGPRTEPLSYFRVRTTEPNIPKNVEALVNTALI